jgi:hypothetical protein
LKNSVKLNFIFRGFHGSTADSLFEDHVYGEYQVYLKLQVSSVRHHPSVIVVISYHHNLIVVGGEVCCVNGYISDIRIFLYFTKQEVVRKVDYTVTGEMYHEHAYSGPFITISIEFRCSGSQWM